MGSGGGILGPSDPESLRDRLREAERTATDEAFEQKVGDLVARKLADYNARDEAGIRAILEKVRAELGKDIEGTVDLVFGGSVAKNTYVDGLSDVDALVLLPPSEAADVPPDKVRSQFAERLRATFGRDKVDEGKMAVTVTVDDKTIQLLPAVRQRSGFRISASDGTEWASISPTAFAKALTAANARMDAKLVPTIKLAKGIIAMLPEQRRLTGYHTEALAESIFRAYQGPHTPKAMLRHFFEQAPRAVQTPIRDATRQSPCVDDYLGAAGSVQRRIVADALGRVARIIRNADGAPTVSRWRDLLDAV